MTLYFVQQFRSEIFAQDAGFRASCSARGWTGSFVDGTLMPQSKPLECCLNAHSCPGQPLRLLWNAWDDFQRVPLLSYRCEQSLPSAMAISLQRRFARELPNKWALRPAMPHMRAQK